MSMFYIFSGIVAFMHSHCCPPSSGSGHFIARCPTLVELVVVHLGFCRVVQTRISKLRGCPLALEDSLSLYSTLAKIALLQCRIISTLEFK